MQNRTRFVRAFSLIELLVVMAIFSVISLIVLVNHSRFNSSVLLGSLAYNIALSVREAQVYGVSVQQFGSSFQVGYGVHLAGNSSYIFFADRNTPPNKQYDSATDAVIKNYSLNRQHSIARFCGVTSTDVWHCSDDNVPITFLDIVFLRPDPDAYMKSDQFDGYSRAVITVRSNSGEERVVTVASTGQIAVANE